MYTFPSADITSRQQTCTHVLCRTKKRKSKTKFSVAEYTFLDKSPRLPMSEKTGFQNQTHREYWAKLE